MSDKQLTVAELMARAAQEGNSPRESRPRRRRSLDEGGVSVAELTGSIPRVNKNRGIQALQCAAGRPAGKG